MQVTHIEGGFSSPVLDAQAAFRAIMDGMARPGTTHLLTAMARPPAPLSPAAATVALALCDQDTPVWLDPALRAGDAVAAWLGFHCGATLAHTPAEAHFAFASEPSALIALDNFAQGIQEYPDRSATLVLQVDTLGGGGRLALEGPGIESVAHVAPSPMPRHFVEQWKQNNARFPRGVDVILAAPQEIACLPRTTRIATQEG